VRVAIPSIDGAARLYAILGDPIAHVRSVAGWNDFFARTGRNAVMLPLHVTAADLPGAVTALRQLRNLDGFVLTMPHKQAVLGLIDLVLPMARRIGAVNTVRRTASGGFEGDMFDGLGFVEGLRAAGCAVAGRRATLLGAGGAGRAIAFALAEAGLGKLRIGDAAAARARGLREDLRTAYPALAVDDASDATDPDGFDLVVNATPVGMRDSDAPAFVVERLRREQVVCDVIPNPEMTALLRAAQAAGCPIVTGKAMFEGQARVARRFLRFADG